MKQKYKLSIADVELNVTVDESPETVEYIVGVIDRKMREILLKSKYCPKTNAALLCALDLCADKVKAKEEIESLGDELASLEDELKKAEEKIRKTDALTVALEKEKARLEIENMKLRAAIEQAQKTGNLPEGDVASITASEKEADDAIAQIQQESEQKEAASKKSQNKSRVGSMFDLLTFSDI